MSAAISALRLSAFRPVWKNSAVPFDANAGEKIGRCRASSAGTRASLVTGSAPRSRVRRVSGSGYAAVPTWAPDGRRLAFIRAEPGRPNVWNLWLLAMDSARLQPLTHYTHGQTWSASWFPDGQRLCYTHEDKLVLLDLPTQHTREFDSPIAHRLVRTPAVSPDGSKVIFQVYRHGAWLLDLADASMRCVLADPSAEEFAWAPDGRRVAFHSRRDGQWGIYVLARGS